MLKKLILPALLIVFCTMAHTQPAGWMMGTWKSTAGTSTPSGSVTNTIRINDVTGESFTGIKTSEINDGLHAEITISISGSFKARGLILQYGEIVNKGASQNKQWYDCSACAQANKMIVKRDSLILIDSISGCDNGCDAVTFYYRLLSEYDDDTQRYLVDRFGRPSDIIGFRPYQQQKNDTIAANHDDESLKNGIVSGAAKINSNIKAIKNEEKNRQDSLDNIARVKQQQLNDAARLALQKKREQEITDSLDLAKQKEQQRISDSLNKIVKLKQQQTVDSARLAQQRKREQEIADSVNLVQQREQQRMNDSLNNVARQEQINRQTEDSLHDVQRQQAVADSLNLINQKRQQYINDSLQNVATANLQKQRTADSLSDVQSKERQQEADSLAAVHKQQYNDSLQKAALAKAAPLPVTDSVSSAANKALTSRTSILLKTYHITLPDILIELFDNGEIDSDRVSVYHNNAIIVSNQTLGIKPITINIRADATNREHEFVLVAENLGSIPPNSALMRITVGKQIYKLSVNTDMKTNARIVFYYDGN